MSQKQKKKTLLETQKRGKTKVCQLRKFTIHISCVTNERVTTKKHNELQNFHVDVHDIHVLVAFMNDIHYIVCMKNGNENMEMDEYIIWK